jgi:CheY-like chemotaxis protein
MTTDVKVLVIDDVFHIRRLITRMLEQAGFVTLEAANGLDGLKILREQKPDIVTCDISMPIMDGHQFLAEVKRDPETKSIPVIIITAVGEQVKAIKASEWKADAYLTKPFSSNSLVETIHNQLHKQSD